MNTEHYLPVITVIHLPFKHLRPFLQSRLLSQILGGSQLPQVFIGENEFGDFKQHSLGVQWLASIQGLIAQFPELSQTCPCLQSSLRLQIHFLLN